MIPTAIVMRRHVLLAHACVRPVRASEALLSGLGGRSVSSVFNTGLDESSGGVRRDPRGLLQEGGRACGGARHLHAQHGPEPDRDRRARCGEA